MCIYFFDIKLVNGVRPTSLTFSFSKFVSYASGGYRDTVAQVCCDENGGCLLPPAFHGSVSPTHGERGDPLVGAR